MNIKNYLGEIKKCPQCGNTFICHEKTISDCFCSKINLSKEILDEIHHTFSGCLCKDCLNLYIKKKKIYSF